MESEMKWNLPAMQSYCERFAGTPHMQRRLIEGRGADCVRFAVGAIQASGNLPEFEWPTYRQDIGFHRNRNSVADLMLDHFHCESVEIEAWEPHTGDIAIFRPGKVSNHVGVLLADRLWHVTVQRGVHDCSLTTIRKSLQEIIRLTRPGLRKIPTEVKAT